MGNFLLVRSSAVAHIHMIDRKLFETSLAHTLYNHRERYYFSVPTVLSWKSYIKLSFQPTLPAAWSSSQEPLDWNPTYDSWFYTDIKFVQHWNSAYLEKHISLERVNGQTIPDTYSVTYLILNDLIESSSHREPVEWKSEECSFMLNMRVFILTIN
jgi:hypothetical protein